MADEDRTLPPDPDATMAATGDPGANIAALPDRIGRYHPLRVLGRGGMGVVYEAEQEEPRRRVALKVIRPELATDELHRRFAHESVFLARLQHPGIAQVYEAGTAETAHGPMPFIAMELVDGAPLDHWVRTQEPDRRTLVELMIHLCDAVQHAHQRGLIHRDLKPGNVLVDARGRPRVLDFGVARPHDADLETSLLTTHGELVGTLAYMSPEQLAGDPDDIDTRSDVYALGVILYQLLAGAPPLDLAGRPLEEVLRAVREDDPPPLAERDPQLAGDLTVIAAAAMAKDRNQRYASANGLRADLQRYLDDQPIAARPPSTIYQLRKFARRHRPLVLGAVGVATALVLGVVASTWQAVRATQAERLAESRLEQAESVTGFLQDMLAAVAPEEARGREVTVREVLDRAADDLDAGSLAAQPAVEMALRRTLGQTYASLGRLDEGARHVERGHALADSLLPPDATERLQLVIDLANTENRRGNHDRAEGLILAEFDRLPPRGELHTRALENLSDVEYTRGHWQAADSLLSIVQEIAVANADADSLEVGAVLVNRAFQADQQRDSERSTRLLDRAEAIYRAGYGDDHPRMIRVLTLRGEIATTAGRHLEAVPPLEEALAIADRVFEPVHPSRADVLARQGIAYFKVNDLDAARAAQAECLAIRREILGPDHADIAVALSVLAAIEENRSQFPVAEAHHREALAMRERLFGPAHASVVASLLEFGAHYRVRNEPARAESLFVVAAEVIEQLPEETGSQASAVAFHTAMSIQDQGDHARAEAHFRRAIAINRERFGDEHVEVARSTSNLSTNLFRQGRKAEAADVQAEALAMQRRLGVGGATLILAVGNAAFLLDDAGRHAEADTLHREYIALTLETYGEAHAYLPGAHGRYSKNLTARGLHDVAETQARLLVAWREEHLPADDYQRHTGQVFLVAPLVGQGQVDEADRLLREVEAYLTGEHAVPARNLPRIQRSVAEARAALDVARRQG